MKPVMICAVLTFGLAASASAQWTTYAPIRSEDKQAIEVDLQAVVAVKPRAAVETQVTKGAPYSAEAVTEFVQTLADGNRITRKTVMRTYRDSEGRTRREQSISGPNGELLSVTVSDPVAGTSFILEPETRTAWRTETVALTAKVLEAAAVQDVAAARVAPPGPAAAASAARAEKKQREVETMARVALAEYPGEPVDELKLARAGRFEGMMTKKDLGERVMEGVTAHGVRTTTVIPAGGIGNEQPITIVSESWRSLDLQVLVATKHSDPRAGETTYRLVNIVRAEQDRSLFEVPADYTLRDNMFIKEPAPTIVPR
jgi:hypothetical protein